MSDDRFTSFEEFWPFYVGEHRDSLNRTLHFAGTTAAVSAAVIALALGRPKLALLAPLLGYGPAWVGHFIVEKNRPATFKYPLWSLMGDFKMWSLMARGKMQAEVDRVIAEAEREAEAVRAAEAQAAEARSATGSSAHAAGLAN